MKKLFRNMNYSVNKVWNILCSAWYFTHVLWCQCKCKVWMQLLPWTKVKNAKQLRALFCPFLIENPWFLVFPSLLRLTQITFKHYYNYCILLASYILILYERLSPHMQVIETILSTKRTLEGVKSNFDFMLLVIFFFPWTLYVNGPCKFLSFVLFHCRQVDFTSVWKRSLKMSWQS